MPAPRTTIFAAAALALALGGCEADEQQPEPEEAVDQGVEQEETGIHEPEQDENISERGHTLLEIGEEGALTNPEGIGLLTLMVTDIEVGGECTNPDAGPAQNGSYIIVSMDMAGTDALLEDQTARGVWSVDLEDFEVVGPDGEFEEDSMGAAGDCLAPEDMLPDEVEAGQEVSGMIALDSAHASGHLAYVPATTEGEGWEWPFGE